MKDQVRPYDEKEEQEALQVKSALRFALPLETAKEDQARRGRLVSPIRSHIANIPAAQRLQRRKASAFKLLAAAALLFVVGGSWASFDMWLAEDRGDARSAKHKSASHLGETEVELELIQKGSKAPPLRKTRREAGDSLSIGAREEAHLEFANGTTMRLENEGSLEFVKVSSRESEVLLEGGRLRVEVPHDHHHKRSVRVATPHATVSVIGTIFTVEVQGRGADSWSKIAVERGVVEVKREDQVILLHAGEKWVSSKPSKSSTSPPGGGPSDPNSPSSKGSVVERLSSKEPPSEGTSFKSTSDLAEQNRMIERALSAEESGDLKGALQVLDAFPGKYPSSPLLESVQVARSRVMTEIGRGSNVKRSPGAKAVETRSD